MPNGEAPTDQVPVAARVPQPSPAVTLLSVGRLAQASPRDHPGLACQPTSSRRSRENPVLLPADWGLLVGPGMARRWALGRIRVLAGSGQGHSQLPEAATCLGSWPQPPPSKSAIAGFLPIIQGGLSTSRSFCRGRAHPQGPGGRAWTSGGGRGRVIVPPTTSPAPKPKTKHTTALTLSAFPSLRDDMNSHTFHPRITGLD